MGAPMGHPFFGNQYTDGGYIPGSFRYISEVAEKSVEAIANSVKAVKSAACEMSGGAPSKALTIAADHQDQKNIVLAAIDKISSKEISKNILIVAGILTVATTGGILLYRHFRKKSKAKKEIMKAIDFSVGICIRCSEPLIESTFVPRSESNNKDAFIICKNCGERNFAWYPDEDTLS